MAPSTSSFLKELDITDDNNSQIRFQIRDTVLDKKMTIDIKDDDLEQYLIKNTETDKYLEREPIDFEEFELCVKDDPDEK